MNKWARALCVPILNMWHAIFHITRGVTGGS